jgi:uncharacterized membrane protein YccC
MFYLILYALGAVLGLLLSQYAVRRLDKAVLSFLGFTGLLLPYLAATLVSSLISMFCVFTLSMFIKLDDEDGTDESGK